MATHCYNESRESEPRSHLQSPHLEILARHDDLVETVQDRQPILDHRFLSLDHLLPFLPLEISRCWEMALWALEHLGYRAPHHLDRLKTDLLEFRHLAKVGHAAHEVGKAAVLDHERKVVLVDVRDEVKGVVRHPLGQDLGRGGEDGEHGAPT